MANIINLFDYIQHNEGPAKCLACGKTWVAAAPTGVCFFQCPKCKCHKGQFLYPVEKETQHYSCNCGNFYMLVTKEGIYCPNCGLYHRPFD